MGLNENIPNLELDMNNDAIVIAYLSNQEVAVEFYSALCDMRWKKISTISEDEQIIKKLKGIDDIWSCTWRYSGQIIADIRDKHYGTGEDYLDFYCYGNEGIVSNRVKECFERMGWKTHPWD